MRLRRTSGTPDTLHVKTIEPFAKAAKGRPDGASVTVKVSMMSAYSSFEVCLTLARRHGSADVFEGRIEGELEFEKLVARFPGFLGKSCQHRPVSNSYRRKLTRVG